jgi:hypothetical protein
MAHTASGHLERLPSGSYRVHVYAGTDPLTGRELRHRQTVKTEEQARIVLGRLLERASAGQPPEAGVTVAELLARYMEVGEFDVSTRRTYEGYIRRTILPALGCMELRKVRGPILDTFYARLRRCADVTCTGRPFVKHSAFPVLAARSGTRCPGWQQITGAIREAAGSGRLAPGEQIPSARELASRNGLPVAAVRRALAGLAAEGVIVARRGRRAVVSGEVAGAPPGRGPAAGTDHDCARAGCQAHRCRPMAATTIRQVHSILSGAFATAVRWEWIERNPAAAARLPRPRPRPPSSPKPDTVATVIAAARTLGMELLALYLWLAAVTGAPGRAMRAAVGRPRPRRRDRARRVQLPGPRWAEAAQGYQDPSGPVPGHRSGHRGRACGA